MIRGQDRAGKDKTGQERTGQDGAGRDRTGMDRTEQDGTGQHRTGQDRTERGRTGQGGTGQDRTGQDRTGQGRTAQDTAHPRHPAPNGQGVDPLVKFLVAALVEIVSRKVSRSNTVLGARVGQFGSVLV